MDALLLKYPLELFQQGRLLLAGHWPLWMLTAALAAGLLAIVISLTRNGSRLALWQRTIIGGLQFSALALCLLLLWQPALEINRLREQVNAVALMIDGSASMGYSDDGLTRQARAAAIAADPALAAIAQRYPMMRFEFGQRLRPLADEQPAGAGAPATHLFDSLVAVLERSRSAALAAVVVVSDGIDESPQWQPEQLAELAGYGVPVHTVAVGREKIEEDVAITNVLVPARAVPDSRIRARVDIAHDAAHRVVLTVSAGDEILAVAEHQLDHDDSRNAALSSIWVELALAQAGHHALEFRLAPVAGESNLHNNRLVRMLAVGEDQLRVLYLEGEPRWEYKFLRRALGEDGGIRLHSLLRVSPNRFYRQGIESPEQLADGFPRDAETLFEYDALIIGSIEAASLDEAQIDAISRFVRLRGGGLLMLGGRAGLGEGGWGASSLAAVLPASLPAPGSGSFQRQLTPIQPPQASVPALLPRLAEDPEAEPSSWSDLPALADFQRLGALKPAAHVLLSMQPDRDLVPLLVQQPYGLGQVAILATGGTWRWQMSLPVEDRRHEQFWRQLVRNLASGAAERFSLSAEVEGDAVVVRADLRHADFTPVDAPAVTVQVSEGSRPPRPLRLEPEPGAPGSFVSSLRPERSQSVFVEASEQSDPDAPVARAAVSFDAERAEFATLRSNGALLRAVADTTGGRFWAANDLQRLPEAVARSGAGVSERQVLSLWDAPILFLMLIGLKSGEWLLRRRWAIV